MSRIVLRIIFILAALSLNSAANPVAAQPLDQWPSTMVWSTLLGGEHSEKGLSIVIDSDGNLLITGRTMSPDFPTTPGCYDATHGGMNDVFVAKLDPSGTTLIWSTLLGGSGDDVIPTITVDSMGNPVLAGTTTSSDFPTTAGAFDSTSNGLRDGWIVKLDASGGELIWCTYWGGSGNEVINRVLMDQDDCPVVAGYTTSADLPMTLTSHDPVHNGNWDAFVGRFSPDGSQLLAATYLGGPGDDIGNGLVLDQAGHAVVVGEAGATGFPTTAGAFQTSSAGGIDIFVSKLDMTDATLTWSTLIGGSGHDTGVNLVLDTAGRPVVTGSTTSANFPTTAGVFDEVFNGNSDACISVFDPEGGTLEWSTFFGGSGSDKGWALTVDPDNQVVVVGVTNSADLPSSTATFDPPYNGSNDVFITRFSHGGTSLGFSTYLGGESMDEAYATVMNQAGHLLVIGMTQSPTFPTTSGAYQEMPHGDADAFIAHFDLALMSPSSIGTVSPLAGLCSIHPNPFNPTTVISFSLAAQNQVRLDVYDVGGRLVRRLLETTLPSGGHEIKWDGRGDTGMMVPSGQYFARLTMGSSTQVRKMVLVR